MSHLEQLRQRTPEMVDALATLVAVESPSSDLVATAECARVARSLAVDLLGSDGELLQVEGRSHLRWRFGSATKVVLLGHLDTVWATGTTAVWPFEVNEDNATGPGCFDMKGGVVQLLFATAALDDLDGVVILLTTDEELGSPSSRDLIAESVADAEAVLVLEPSASGSLKTQRKGVSTYRVEVTGRAAHAGLDPENGINAALEIAHQVVAISELAAPEIGTTVTPSVLTGGTTTNTVPSKASVAVDARAFTAAEQERVDAGLRSLEPTIAGAKLTVERVTTTAPLERTSSQALYARAQEVAADIGIGALTEKAVGGGSDGNFTAGLGIPTLDGLGPVGGNAHAEGEWISISAMPERAALVSGLLSALLRG
ncbi:MAG TPA: M20 family metallopeptidase [Actinomycetota bacterium]|nr:M20 family metallopeptidase [Actinomycetota bacterium]